MISKFDQWALVHIALSCLTDRMSSDTVRLLCKEQLPDFVLCRIGSAWTTIGKEGQSLLVRFC